MGELVKDQEMCYEPEEDPNHFSFFMKDKKGIIKKVVYKGGKPQDFERSQEIVSSGYERR